MPSKVSIVVPIYKVEKYLRRCVDSIINQTYRNLEIILVDDGSPDKCGQIIDEYKEKDSRIISLHKKNGGLSDARNYGMKYVTGEYIFFTKFYKAVTYEQSSNSVSEKNIDELAPGDSLIFFKKNDYTRNVVDFIFELLLDEGRFSEEIIENYEKSRYWKEVLSS